MGARNLRGNHKRGERALLRRLFSPLPCGFLSDSFSLFLPSLASRFLWLACKGGQRVRKAGARGRKPRGIGEISDEGALSHCPPGLSPPFCGKKFCLWFYEVDWGNFAHRPRRKMPAGAARRSREQRRGAEPALAIPKVRRMLCSSIGGEVALQKPRFAACIAFVGGASPPFPEGKRLSALPTPEGNGSWHCRPPHKSAGFDI